MRRIGFLDIAVARTIPSHTAYVFFTALTLLLFAAYLKTGSLLAWYWTAAAFTGAFCRIDYAIRLLITFAAPAGTITRSGRAAWHNRLVANRTDQEIPREPACAPDLRVLYAADTLKNTSVNPTYVSSILPTLGIVIGTALAAISSWASSAIQVATTVNILAATVIGGYSLVMRNAGDPVGHSSDAPLIDNFGTLVRRRVC